MKVEIGYDFNKSLRIFNKKVQESGMLKDIRDRMFYEPKSVEKQRKKKSARKRWERDVENMISNGEWQHGKPY